jgi:outer membrane protein assembly factor BamB
VIARLGLLLVLAVALGAGSPSARVSKAPPCQVGALVSLRTGKVLRRFSALGGAVPDGRGGWFVARGGTELRRMRHDGSLRKGWHSRPTRGRAIGGLVRLGEKLYVNDGYRVFALSARTGRRLWTSQRAHQGPRVGILAMAATLRAVYIGGYLTQVGEMRRRRLAALDARTGRLLPWQAPPLGYYRGSFPVVTALALSPARLYFGGSFLSVGGARRLDGVAAVRLRDGRLTTFAPRSTVWNLSTLVVAGRRVLIGGPEGGGVFDARTGTRRPGMAPLPSASAITVHGATAYLGGDLRTSIGGHNLLAIDLRSGKLNPWSPNLARYVTVGGIAITGTKAFVGGSFCSSIG